ncbi:unnamed protein product [Amoebophrya sp. A120]|nr:unnamed protein product [Amoebophrya sp. A120]|eukprot:GSA120T00010497001.1
MVAVPDNVNTSLKRPLEEATVEDPDGTSAAKKQKLPEKLASPEKLLPPEDVGAAPAPAPAAESEKTTGKPDDKDVIMADSGVTSAPSAMPLVGNSAAASSSSTSAAASGGPSKAKWNAGTVMEMMQKEREEQLKGSSSSSSKAPAIPPGKSVKQPAAAGASTSTTTATGPLSYWNTSTGEGTAENFRSGNKDAQKKLNSTNYHPATCSYEKGKPLPFQLITDGLTMIEEMIGSGKGSNKMKIVVLTNLFRTIMLKKPEELISACYFLLSKVAADYENVEVGVGDALVFKAVSTAFSSSPQAIQDLITRSEAQDVGEAALILKMKTRQIMTPARLTITKVFTEIRDKIAKVEGKNSQKTKQETMQKLIAATQRDEVKYLVRSFQAKLRVGINTATILTSLAHAVVFAECCDKQEIGKAAFGTSEELDVKLQKMELAVKKAYCEMPNYERITKALLEKEKVKVKNETTGLEEEREISITPEKLGKVCKITPGIPLKPMLAKPSKGISEVMERLAGTKFTAEFKYDGERAQVHVYKTKSGKIEYRIYSRNSENMTQKYPDVLEIVKANMTENVTSLIVDAEIVAYEPATKTIQPFQKLSTRSKKNVKVEEIKVQVCLFAFDLIFLNGRPWTGKTLRERRDKLVSNTVLKKEEGKLHFAEGKDMDLEEEPIQQYLNEAINASCEGLMLKTLDDNATYEPSKRSLNWLKLKKDYMQGMSDSVDVVPIGAWFGTGKRTGVFGSYLLACYNPDNDEFQTLCKAGTGYSDEDLKQHHQFFKDKTRTDRPDGNVLWNDTPAIKPDVWLEICQVWEVKAADLSISPVHCAATGMAHPDKGIALRFPRFIRIRDDKNPEDATTNEQIKQMYDQQAVISSGGTADVAGDDDFL